MTKYWFWHVRQCVVIKVKSTHMHYEPKTFTVIPLKGIRI